VCVTHGATDLDEVDEGRHQLHYQEPPLKRRELPLRLTTQQLRRLRNSTTQVL
jgi:hypothetical protein